MTLKFILIYLGIVILLTLIFKLFKKGDIEEQKEVANEEPEYEEKELKFENKNLRNKKVEVKNIKKELINSDIDLHTDLYKIEEKVKTLKEDIRKEFDYDYEKIIGEFLRILDDSNNYELCNNLKNIFTSEIIYQIKCSSNWLESVKKLLNNKQQKILNAYLSINKKFNLDDFIIYIDELVKLNSKNVTIYTSPDLELDMDLDENIEIIKDNSIYEGIKIKYQSRLYDFSLNGRDL